MVYVSFYIEAINVMTFLIVSSTISKKPHAALSLLKNNDNRYQFFLVLFCNEGQTKS